MDKNMNAEERAQLREQLADQEHERWSRWMKHLFSLCLTNGNGDKIINIQFVERWQRQIDTPYVDLSEKEKDSDRREADNTLKLIETKLTHYESVMEAAQRVIAWKKERVAMSWAPTSGDYNPFDDLKEALAALDTQREVNDAK